MKTNSHNLSRFSRILTFSYSHIVFAVLVWSLLILRFGYRFGTGDQVELLSYTLFLNDNSLYAHDFFIQGLNAAIPNERTVISYLLLPVVNHLEVVCFICQFLTTVFLILGIQKLGVVLAGNIHVVRIAILINFFLFFDRGLGNVELYSDGFQASSFSVAFVAFALYYFFRQKYLPASFLIAIASVIHPLEGLTVYLVMVATMMVYTFFQKNISKAEFWKSIAVYVFIAGVYMTLLASGKEEGTLSHSAKFDKEMFFRIYYEFRHPHHFIFSYFPFHEKILFVAFMFITITWGFINNRKLFWFCLWALIGTLVYIASTDYLHLIEIANLQFYKVTQWTKIFALLIASKYLFTCYEQIFGGWTRWLIAGTGLLAGFILVLFFKPQLLLPKETPHQFTRNWKEEDDAVAISREIDKRIDKNAVFVQPFDCSELKYFGRTSSWVEFKAFAKNRGLIFEWYRRIKLLYGISVADDQKGFELRTKAENFFFNLDENLTEKLKREGVTHMLTLNKHWQCGKLLFENKTYAVYQL